MYAMSALVLIVGSCMRQGRHVSLSLFFFMTTVPPLVERLRLASKKLLSWALVATTGV
jgi:hypothetical protein